MADLPSADALAQAMVQIGTAHGVATSAIVSRMDDVLGRTVGNALEVSEALDVLAGEGPADVIELSLALADDMARLVGIDVDLRTVLSSGAAYEVFDEMVAAQGGNLRAGLPVAPYRRVIRAVDAGVVQGLDARRIGLGAWHLGAGRARKEDSVSATAGVVCLVRPGECVDAGQPVLELHADDDDRFARAERELVGAVPVGSDPPKLAPIVVERVG
jgi:thymidine phosphorylase